MEFDLVLNHKRKSSKVEMIILDCQVYVFPFPAGNHGLCVIKNLVIHCYIHVLLTFLTINLPRPL